MNFFANVVESKVELFGPIQTPANYRKALAQLLNRSESDVSIGTSRTGGGFGRRQRGVSTYYSHDTWVAEVAEITIKMDNLKLKKLWRFQIAEL